MGFVRDKKNFLATEDLQGIFLRAGIFFRRDFSVAYITLRRIKTRRL